MNNSVSLKERSKSFFWASFFFSKEERKLIDNLYSFCRFIDDISDSGNLDKSTSKKILKEIKKEIKKKKSDNIIISKFLGLIKNLKIDAKIPLDLIDGVLSDLNKVNFINIKELENYSYSVAGTVGLMMCSIMNIKHKSLKIHAIELGIAMQITNIARDIREDLDKGRLYMPQTLRSFNFKNLEELKNNKNKINLFCKDNIKMITYSDAIYTSAKMGIYKLPFKYRLPIMLASNLYQEIGRKILKNPLDVWKTRVYVSILSKIFITFKTILNCLLPNFKKTMKIEY